MNKITSKETNTRRQLLLSFVAGATGLITSAVFAKLTSDIGVGNLIEQTQHQSTAIQSNEHFVMYF